MRVHTEWEMCAVLENDFESIARLAPQHGADNAQMLPLGFTRLQRTERAVGVLPIHRFSENPAYMPRIVHYEESRPLIVGLAGHVVDLGRRVVPIHLIGRNVVSMGCASLFGW